MCKQGINDKCCFLTCDGACQQGRSGNIEKDPCRFISIFSGYESHVDAELKIYIKAKYSPLYVYVTQSGVPLDLECWNVSWVTEKRNSEKVEHRKQKKTRYS